jgi:hypothetical protein
MGAYAFAIPVPEGHDRAQDFAVAVSAWSNLNEAASQKVAVRSSETTTLNFSLPAKSSAEIGGVQGRVTNAATGKGVPGVAISIVGAGGDLATLTQADGSYAFPRVGLGPILVIRAIPQKPPCLVPAERSFNMVQPVALEDFPLANAFSTAVHCPTVAGGPPGHLQ